MDPVILIPMPIPELIQIIRREMKLMAELEKPEPPTASTSQWMDIDELCQYHPDKPAKQTVYGWISHNTIPSHKTGKKRRFFKPEIDEWLKEGKNITTRDIEMEIDRVTGTLQAGKRKKLIASTNN